MTTSRAGVDTSGVGLLEDHERDSWDTFVASQPATTIYHSMAWRTVTEEGFGHRAYYLRARDGTGRITGVLPLFLVRGATSRRLTSLPMRDRGGVLTQSDDVAISLVDGAVELAARLGCRLVEIRARDPMPRAVENLGFRQHQHWITSRVDLTAGQESLWGSMDRKVRWAIRKAARDGVHVSIDDSARGIDMFYRLFERTRHSMGIPIFPRELFDSIHRNVIATGRGTLFITWSGDTPINAMIGLRSGNTLIPAYVAPQREWRKLYPSEVLFWHAIEWAIANGFREFDFGADSPRQTGLLWFKKKLGGVQHPMNYYYHSARAGGAGRVVDSSTPTFEIAREVWRRLPLAVARRIGPWITRRLS